MPFLVVLLLLVTVILVVIVVVLTAPVVLAQTGYFIVSTVLVLVLEYEHLRLVLVQVAVMEGSVRVHDEHTRRGQRVDGSDELLRHPHLVRRRFIFFFHTCFFPSEKTDIS